MNLCVLCTFACYNVKCKGKTGIYESQPEWLWKSARVLTGESTPEMLILRFLWWKYTSDNEHQSEPMAILISWNIMMSNTAVRVTWSVFLMKNLWSHFQFICLPVFGSFVLCCKEANTADTMAIDGQQQSSPTCEHAFLISFSGVS